MVIKDREFQAQLRKIFTEGLTGYLSVVYLEGKVPKYGTIIVSNGELQKASYLGLYGKAAMEKLCPLNFVKVTFSISPVLSKKDIGLPSITEFTGGTKVVKRNTTPTHSQQNPNTGKSLIPKALMLMGELYGKAGQERVRQLIATFPPVENPNLFLDMCQELLEPMFGKKKARRLMQLVEKS